MSKNEMIMLPREVVEQAISALKSDEEMATAFYLEISALCTALEQPQSDPAPYLYYDPANGDTWTQEAIDDGFLQPDGLIALYTRPHRTPLTDERIDACFPVQWEGEFYKAWRQEVGRSIERTHGIGGEA